MKDHAGRPDEDRNAQRELVGRELEWSEPGALLGQTLSGDDASGARGPAGVDLLVPVGELPGEVLVVEKAALLEEGPFHPADQVLDGALLLGAVRPAQLDAEPQVERDAGEGRVPLGDSALSVPLEGDRLGPVEDGQERDPTHRGEVIDERADERLDALVGDQRHLHPARVLQPRSEEVHAATRPIEVTDVDLAEVVL